MKTIGSVVLLVAILCITVHAAGNSDKFRFAGEDIYMQVLEDSVEVVGFYKFRSTIDEDRRWPIFYPYVNDEFHGAARTIVVEEMLKDTARPLKFKDRKMGSTWELDLPANSEKTVRVVYRQRLKSNRATYILKTTRSWGHPLPYANFYVTLPQGRTEGVILSYLADDTTHNEDGAITYIIRRKDLMPEKDLTVSWRGQELPMEDVSQDGSIPGKNTLESSPPDATPMRDDPPSTKPTEKPQITNTQ